MSVTGDRQRMVLTALLDLLNVVGWLPLVSVERISGGMPTWDLGGQGLETLCPLVGALATNMKSSLKVVNKRIQVFALMLQEALVLEGSEKVGDMNDGPHSSQTLAPRWRKSSRL
jgi:hypothetical protein